MIDSYNCSLVDTSVFQITIKVTKLNDVLFEKVLRSNYVPYQSIVESFFFLYGNDITVNIIYSSFEDTPILNGLAR